MSIMMADPCARDCWLSAELFCPLLKLLLALADVPVANGQSSDANGQHVQDLEANGEAAEEGSDADDGPDDGLGDASKKKKKKKSKGECTPWIR